MTKKQKEYLNRIIGIMLILVLICSSIFALGFIINVRGVWQITTLCWCWLVASLALLIISIMFTIYNFG